MFKYINYEDAENVKKLIDEGFDINTIYGTSYETPLISACSRFKINKEIVEIIATTPNVDPNIKDSFGFTALHHAVNMMASAEKAKIIRILFNIPNFDINIKNREGQTPLHIAVNRGNGEIVKTLLEHPDILLNEVDNSGFTPLAEVESSSYFEHYDMIKKALVDAGAQYNLTPFSALACRKFEEFKQLTLEDINMRDVFGMTLLNKAVDLEFAEFVEYILTVKGVDVNMGDDQDWTPLHRASSDGLKDILKMLIKAGADIEAKTDDNQTPEAVAYDLETREILMGMDAEPSLIRREPVCVICLNPNPTCVTYPCGHCCFHVECNKGMKNCPMCRKPILGKLRLI